MRRRLEELEEARLAVYAVRSAEATRRYPVEDDNRAFDYRLHFQRDRDRLLYSRAFRRLRQKGLGPSGSVDDVHERNRLTHTLEVTQLARTIGRALRLNEDLIEAIALGHDLGQPPFGPEGERLLDALLGGQRDGHGGTDLGDLGGFRRALHSLRVVDRLEKRYAHPGLNLTDQVREGIVKCTQRALPQIEAQPPAGVRWGRGALFEAQVVRVADRIATISSDLDDALQSGRLELGRAERLSSLQTLRKKLGAEYPSRGGRFMKINAIHRGMTHWLATAAIVHAGTRLRRWLGKHHVDGPSRFVEVREEAVEGNEIDLPPTARRSLDELEGYLETKLRRSQQADRIAGQARRVLAGLFLAFFHDPTLLEDHVLLRYKDNTGRRFLRDGPRSELGREVAEYQADPAFVRELVDYIAGMTDPYALRTHAELMAMGAVPIPGSEQLRRETRTESDLTEEDVQAG